MSFILAGSQIKNPQEISESNSTQVAVQRTIRGRVNRDYFGDNKRVWKLRYQNIKGSDYTVIAAIYASHLATGAAQTWQVTETNYTIAQTNVHVDLPDRDFSVRGDSYISDVELTLTEV